MLFLYVIFYIVMKSIKYIQIHTYNDIGNSTFEEQHHPFILQVRYLSHSKARLTLAYVVHIVTDKTTQMEVLICT